MFFTEEFFVKLADTKIYLRQGPDFEPQIIRMEPMIDDDQVLNIDIVQIFVDNQEEPIILDRESANLLLLNTNSIPIETVLNFKHKLRN